MRVRVPAVVVAVAVAATLPAGAAAPIKVTVSPVIVTGSSLPVVRSLVAGIAGVSSVVSDLPLVNGVLAKLTTVQIAQVRLSANVSPDAVVLTAMAPTKGAPPAPARQLDNVFPQVTGASAVVAGGNTGAGVGVAVIDTGIADLPDFAGRLRPGVDLSGEGNPWNDGYGHGTFVAGLVAGNGASSGGTYVGEAPGADLVPVKVAGRSGSTTMSTVIRGLQWVKDQPAGSIRVVNMSLGAIPQGPTLLNPLDQAVEAMWRAGFVVVTSAGNNGNASGTITSPGDDPLVITVGALDDKDTVDRADDTVPDFSSHGPTSSDAWWKPDLLAPGRSVVSVMPSTSAIWGANRAARVGSRNFVGSGTSFSAAITSGAAALLVRENPAATPDNVKAALLSTTDAGPGPPYDPMQQGHGVLNVARAVAEPLITIDQSVFSTIVPPAAGALVSLATTQLTSTWATLLLPYPYPFSGAAVSDVFFGSGEWNPTGWDTKAWNTKAWNGADWNTKAWNTKAWNGATWNGATWS